MIRTLDRRLATLLGLTIGGAYVLGVLSLLAVLFLLHLGPFSRPVRNQGAWRDPIQNSPGLRPSIDYEVHDGRRPQPTVITPGTFGSDERPGKPPSDAIVLFDGQD